VVSTVDPFGLYTADIEAGLNDAFVEKAGSGDDLPEDGTPRVAVSAVRPVPSAVDGQRPAGAAVPQAEASSSPAVNGHGPEAQAELPSSDIAAAAAAQAHGAGPAEVEAALGGALEHSLPPISTRPAFDATAASVPAPMPSLALGTLDGEVHDAAIDAILQKDAFLVFRALCKLSIRTADVSSGTDLTAIRGKVWTLLCWSNLELPASKTAVMVCGVHTGVLVVSLCTFCWVASLTHVP
jgi:brefeldin A-inhibited guanine nucleotide-exchange protein